MQQPISIKLKKSSGSPLYRQIYQQLREKILRGELAAEERLPSSRKLAEESGVGRITVLQAYDLLQAEGFIVTKVGVRKFCFKKVFCKEDNPDIVRLLTRFNKLGGTDFSQPFTTKNGSSPS